MKFSLLPMLMLLAFLCLMNAARAYDFDIKVIYGEDNRLTYADLDASIEPETVQAADAVLAQIPSWRIDQTDKDFIRVTTKDLKTGLNVCAEERFSDAPLVSSCTAFLVAPNLILTAGHCIKDKYECKKQTWVLDFNDGGEFTAPSGTVSFPRSKAFQCAELVSWSNNPKLDYALIRLDRAVSNVRPLPLRRQGKIKNDEILTVIGHPLGMPKLISDFAEIRDNSLTYTFKTNTDTFSGNSGSPVIGFDSKVVEGLLIRGEDDFELNLDSLCQRPKRCEKDECRGEVIQRSTVLPLKLIPKI